MSVMLSPQFIGRNARARSPSGAHARVGVIATLHPDSSMKTNWSASISSTASS
jgi:hypothetical protein